MRVRGCRCHSLTPPPFPPHARPLIDTLLAPRVVIACSLPSLPAAHALQLLRPTCFPFAQRAEQAQQAPAALQPSPWLAAHHPARPVCPPTPQGMEALRDTFADSRIYCGGFTGQQLVTMMHGHRRLQGALEVVPGIYIGGGEAAVAEVATGGLQQVRRPAQLGQEAGAGSSPVVAVAATEKGRRCRKSRRQPGRQKSPPGWPALNDDGEAGPLARIVPLQVLPWA